MIIIILQTWVTRGLGG